MPQPQNYNITVFNTDTNGAVGSGTLQLAENDSGQWTGAIDLKLTNVGTVDTTLAGTSIDNSADYSEIQLSGDGFEMVALQNPYFDNQSLSGSAAHGTLIYNFSAARTS